METIEGKQFGVNRETVLQCYRAGSFDRFMRNYLKVLDPNFVRLMNTRITDVANQLQDEKGGGDVCLVSIGSGRDISNLNLKRNTGLRVMGVDINPYMVSGAKKIINQANLQEIISLEEDCLVSEVSSKLGEGKFDLVLWAYSGSCVQDPIDSWKSVIALTKPDGIIIYNDYIGAKGDVRKEQEKHRSVIQELGVRLYTPSELPDSIDPHDPQIIESKGILSIPGESVGGVKEESIVFDTLNPFFSD